MGKLQIIDQNVNVDRLRDMGVSLCAFHDTIRKRVNDDLLSVRLRVIYKSKPYYYTTKIHVSPDDFEQMRSGRPRGVLRDKREIIYEKLKLANDILLEMEGFYPDDFKARYKGERSDWADVWAVFEYQIRTLKNKGRVNYADTYRTSKKSFERFINDENRRIKSFDNITKKWLDDYETWAEKKTKDKRALSRSTIGINTRNLKVLFNLAIKNGGAKINPFNEYKPPTSENIKKALSAGEILAIGKYETDSLFRKKYRDLFIFSYLASGMNFADIFRLRYKNIVPYVNSQGEKREYIVYERKKTSDKRKGTKKTTPLMPAMRRIIETWGNKKLTDNTLIFKALDRSRNETEAVRIIKQETKACNTHLKAITGELGIDGGVSTYTARHSWATHAVQSGQGIHFVQKQLGHSDPKTTEGYVASLGPEMLEQAMSFVVDFD